MAVFSAATPVASALGYIVGGAVLHAHGWRAAFFVAGGPGIVRPSCACSSRRRGAELASPRRRSGAARTLVRNPLYRAGVLGYCAYTFAIGGFAHWAPYTLHERYGVEPGRASILFGLVTLAGGVAGTLVGGWPSDRTVRGRARQEIAQGGYARQADAETARGNLTVCVAVGGVGTGPPPRPSPRSRRPDSSRLARRRCPS